MREHDSVYPQSIFRYINAAAGRTVTDDEIRAALSHAAGDNPQTMEGK